MTITPLIDACVPSANENCLEGVRCPKCGYEDSFEIVALTTATVRDNGTDDRYGTEYDHTADTCCNGCGHRDLLGAFTIDPSDKVRADMHLLRLSKEAGLPFVGQFLLHANAVHGTPPLADVLALTVEDIRPMARRVIDPALATAARRQRG